MKKIIIVICIITTICLCFTGCKSDDYELAVILQNADAYEEALELYIALGDYQDSADRAVVCQNAIDQIEAYNNAESEYDAAALALIDRNEALSEAVSSAKDTLASGKPLDPALAIIVEQYIESAESTMTAPIYAPRDLDSLAAAAALMNDVDYSSILDLLTESEKNLSHSISSFVLVDNPSEEYIVACLNNVPGITGISAATEEHDPNNKLNKDGGYTAAVFFTHENISKTTYSGDAVLNKGTDGGGCLEVYRTVEDAESRNAYLAAFDGSILDSGSHIVIGTVVVRTSSKMTASMQDELESAILSALLPTA